MNTPEQQAREMLGRMGIEDVPKLSAGNLAELTNLITERDALKAELAAIKGAGEPVGYASSGFARRLKRIDVVSLFRDKNNESDVALYTRPAVPLTEEQIYTLYNEHALYQPEGYEVSGWREFARAIEAAHNIKEQA